MIRLSKMTREQVLFLLNESNDPAIAKQYGITRQAVFHIRKKFGIPSSRAGTEDRARKIVELRKQGTSVAEISSVLKKSQSHIYRVLRKNGTRIDSTVKNPG